MDEGRTLRFFIPAVSAVGIALAVAFALVRPTVPSGWFLPVVLFVSMAVSLHTNIRYHRRGGIQGLHVNDAIMVALLFTVPPGAIPVLSALAALVGNAARITDLRKVTFNAGAHALAAVTATVTFHAFWLGGAVLEPRSLLAVVAALAAYNAVDIGLYGLLFRLIEGRTLREMVRVYTVSSVGNLLGGLLLAVIVTTDRTATLFAFVLVIGMHLGYRGYAMALEERKRNQHYHTVTRTLTEVASEDSIERFLTAIRDLFGADSVELLTISDQLPVRQRFDEDGFRTLSDDAPRGDALNEALRRGAPVQLDARRTDPEAPATDQSRSMAAPLIYRGVTIGALAVHGRRGLETHEDQEQQVLASIANDAAIAMQNVQLFRSVEHERSALAEESQKLHDIVDAASDGIAMVDARGRVVAWNPAMEELTGTSGTEALGHPWFMALRFRDATGDELAVDQDGPLRAVLDGDHVVDEPVDLQVLRRDGEWRWVRCTFSPVRRDGAPVGVVLVARDVTRERETEEMKTDFVATVSHELRTPLTPLKGFLVTLIEARDRIDPSEYPTFHRSMLRQVERLETLVSDLLVVADLDRGAIRLKSQITDLTDVVESAVTVERPLQEPHRVEVGPSEPLRVVGDRIALQRIVQALVSNAIKHTHGRVYLEMGQDDRVARVEVHDEGPGIPASERQRVFERFTRLGHHLTRTTQGSGLGLSIAKGLADRLGGELEAGESPRGGAVFTLTIPLAGPRRDMRTGPSSVTA